MLIMACLVILGVGISVCIVLGGLAIAAAVIEYEKEAN